MLKILQKAKVSKKESLSTPPASNPQVITFYSPQATGKSTLAKVFASYYALNHKKSKVFLINFDLFTPTIENGEMLSFNDICKMIKNGDFNRENLIQNLKNTKEIKNLYIISGMDNILDVNYLNRDFALQLINILKEINNSILIIDTGREINLETTLVALDEAETIIFPTIASNYYLKNTQMYLAFLINELKIFPSKINIVLNQYQEGKHYSVKEIEQILGRKIKGTFDFQDRIFETPDIPKLSVKLERQIENLANTISAIRPEEKEVG